MQVIQDEEDRLLSGQPVEQPTDRLEQPRSLHARVAKRRRRRQVKAIEEPTKVR